jgi:hypothetical protein
VHPLESPLVANDDIGLIPPLFEYLAICIKYPSVQDPRFLFSAVPPKGLTFATWGLSGNKPVLVGSHCPSDASRQGDLMGIDNIGDLENPHYSIRSKVFVTSDHFFIGRHGLPTAMQNGGISETITLPAPIMDFRPTVTPGVMVLFPPTQTPS